MTRVPRWLAAVLLGLLGGCNSEYDNPFANSNLTNPLPASAAVMFTGNGYSSRSGAPRELFAVDPAGASLTRLTACNSDTRRCDTVEAAAAADRKRVALRRVSDTDGDGRLTAADGEGLFMVDLSRGVEGTIVPPATRVSGIDWSPAADILVYSATPSGSGPEDLFRVDANGQNNRALTNTLIIRERRPRIDPSGSVAVFERIDATLKGQIWIFGSAQNQVRVTTGGPGTVGLVGTPYMVGSDADPDYSPDGTQIVFRRCTGVGTGNLGTWDILAVRADGTNLRTVATGASFRGAPDWGTRGIVFGEIDTGGRAQLVAVDADGGNRRVLVTLGSGYEISFPRWLP